MRFLMVLIFCGSFCGAQENSALSRNDALPAIHCFHNAKIDIIVLGTIGSSHARNPRFSWVYLDSLLARTSPELLLVQIRPEHFNKQEYFDGAPEMAYLAYLARKTNIDCFGFDYWRDVQLVKWDLVSPATRMAKITSNIRASLAATRAQVVMIAIDLDLVGALHDTLIHDRYKEWSCPQAQFMIKRYPDLPGEMIDIFKNGIIYLTSMPNASAESVQQKIRDLGEIIENKGYLFRR